MWNKKQRVIQMMFLGLFVALLAVSKIQLWMVLILIGIGAAFGFGRIYCGWICPINTALKGVTWMKKKIGFKGFKIPRLLATNGARYLVLGLFILTFAWTMVTGKKIPVLPSLFALAILMTLIFPESLWHRYLCPYGTLMSFPAMKAKRFMKIEASGCSQCGLCERVCPGSAVIKMEGQFQVLKSECMVCLDCKKVCKRKAIQYG